MGASPPDRTTSSTASRNALPTADVEHRGEQARHRLRPAVLDGRRRPHDERPPAGVGQRLPRVVQRLGSMPGREPLEPRPRDRRRHREARQDGDAGGPGAGERGRLGADEIGTPSQRGVQVDHVGDLVTLGGCGGETHRVRHGREPRTSTCSRVRGWRRTGAIVRDPCSCCASFDPPFALGGGCNGFERSRPPELIPPSACVSSHSVVTTQLAGGSGVHRGHPRTSIGGTPSIYGGPVRNTPGRRFCAFRPRAGGHPDAG